MKLVFQGALLALFGTTLVTEAAQPVADPCLAYTTNATCAANKASPKYCVWGYHKQNAQTMTCEKSSDHTHYDCVDRGTQKNDCEADEKCIYTQVGPNKACVEASRGNGYFGDFCQSSWKDRDVNDGGPYWEDAEGTGCADGFMCSLEDAPENPGFGTLVNGTCFTTGCIGKKVPGNCNGNIVQDSKRDCNATTERVTICHRTCSAKNPWVRITIDEDAWNGEGCGHKLQHDVKIECKNKAPWTEWGGKDFHNLTDYLIKEHGTRQEVADRLKNVNDIKAYWRMWEPACPYVRNGLCCDYPTATDPDPENPCCGEPGTTAVVREASIEIKKYSAPVGQCANADKMIDGLPGVFSEPAANSSGLVDDVYKLPNPNAEWQYCWVVSVPETKGNKVPVCLKDVVMSDPAPYGGTGSVNGVLSDILVTATYDPDAADLLCPGETRYIPGEVKTGLPDGPELGFDATATGCSVDDGSDCPSASDASGVTVDYTAAIQVIKSAGKPGDCPLKAFMGTEGVLLDTEIFLGSSMVDGIYESPDGTYQYCYTVKNTGNVCLLDAQMKDINEGGLTSGTPTLDPIALVGVGGDEKFCPGDVIQIEGPPSATAVPLDSKNVEVSGTNEHVPSNKVSDVDPAGVNYVKACPAEMGSKGSDHCPGVNGAGTGVMELNVIGGPYQGPDMIYSIVPSDDGTTIDFKVENPFDSEMEMFVKYHKPTSTAPGTGPNGKGYGWSEACDGYETSACSTESPAITADCLFAEGHPVTLIQVYFMDTAEAPAAFLGGAEVDKCCPVPEALKDADKKVVQYTFLLKCACPAESSSRRTLREGNAGFDLDIDKVLALFGAN